MIVDYSETFLMLDKTLRSVYELMLKNKKEEAAKLLDEMARVAKYSAEWIRDDNN